LFGLIHYYLRGRFAGLRLLCISRQILLHTNGRIRRQATGDDLYIGSRRIRRFQTGQFHFALKTSANGLIGHHQIVKAQLCAVGIHSQGRGQIRNGYRQGSSILREQELAQGQLVHGNADGQLRHLEGFVRFGLVRGGQGHIDFMGA
jgi:hypothetical protein